MWPRWDLVAATYVRFSDTTSGSGRSTGLQGIEEAWPLLLGGVPQEILSTTPSGPIMIEA